MLLTSRKGSKGYEDICTVGGIVHATYREACVALGLVSEDREIYKAMREAAQMTFGNQLIQVFCNILLCCEVADPRQFFWDHKVQLCLHLMRRDRASALSARHTDEVLMTIESRLQDEGFTLEHFNLPEIINREPRQAASREQALLDRELDYDRDLSLIHI